MSVKSNYAPVKSKISTSPPSSFVLSAETQRFAVTDSHPYAFSFFYLLRRSTAQISKVGDGGRRLISKRVHSSPFRNFTLTASTVSKFAFGSLSNGCRIHPRYTRLRLVRVLNFKNNKIVWRWRESNPRPKRHSGNIYMLRLLFFRLNQGKNQNLTI